MSPIDVILRLCFCFLFRSFTAAFCKRGGASSSFVPTMGMYVALGLV